MKIAFLYQYGDPYVDARVKYLSENNHIVYKLNYGLSKSSTIVDGIRCFRLSEKYFFLPMLLKRVIHYSNISRFCKNYSIDILHIGNMFGCFYLLFPNSRIKIIENEGTDVLKAPFQYPFLKYVYRFIYRFADAVIQDSIISQKAGLKYGAPVDNNEVIGFGVDFNIFNYNINKGKAKKEISIINEKIVFSSRGHKDLNNLDIILQSIPYVAKKIPDVRFIFACLKSGFLKKYNKLITKLKIEDMIIVTNRLDHLNKMPYYSIDADVVVSIPTSDSSPASVYEAMACKTPVIISDLPWFEGKFEKDRDLLVVPVRNVEKLANAIVKILNGRSSVDIDSAYKKVFKYINYETENRKLEKFYKKILTAS